MVGGDRVADIKSIKGQLYDFSASGNESFILTAQELKALGIKNYYFMLKIINPVAATIDPFKQNITKEEVQVLMQECRNNMWFFIRSMVRLRTDAGIVRYGLHRGLAAALWCFEHHYDNCLCEPRQTWKTSGTLGGPILWAFQLSQFLHMHFFGKETENTKRNLDSLRVDIELLPEWIQFRKYLDDGGKQKKSRSSSEILQNGVLKNDITIHPKPSSLTHAQGMGRGGSGAILYFDEIEFTPFFGEILGNSAPLFKTAADNAKAAGKAYCRMMSTTPGNLDTKEGREVLPIIKSMIPWTERIYDMTPEEIEEYKSAFREEYHNTDESLTREVLDVFYIEYQYYQIRKDYQWVQEQYKLIGDKATVRREILLQRLRGSTESPFSPEDIEYLISNMQKSTKDIIINGMWRFLLYSHGQKRSIAGNLMDFDPDIPYLVGIDPSGGGGGDNFSITVVNPYNLQIAAEFKSPYISGPKAVKMLVSLVEEYIPKAILCIEKNSMGCTIIQMIAEQTNIKNNLYWNKEKDVIEAAMEDDPTEAYLKMMSDQLKKYGTYTSKKVRDLMFTHLFDLVSAHIELLNTENVVDDMCKLVRFSTGKIAAGKGEHDDCIMSYLHAIYVYFHGDNLYYFGFDKDAHPIFDPIDPDLTFKQAMDNSLSAFFKDKENQTYEDFELEDRVRFENEIKDQVNTLSFMHDEIYKRQDDQGDGYNNTVDISAHFFDMINNT